MNFFLSACFTFIIGSVAGWVAQGFYVGFKKHHFVNTGFLYGPYVPIYGFGALLIRYCIDPFFHSAWSVFLGSFLICSLLEYVTSWAMQKLFHRLWWNYSNRPFNLHGRVCLLNSTLYGLGGVLMKYAGTPFLVWLQSLFSIQALEIFEGLFFVVFFTDLACTLIHMYKVRHHIHSLHSFMQTQEPVSMDTIALSWQAIITDRHVRIFPAGIISEPYRSSLKEAKKALDSTSRPDAFLCEQQETIDFHYENH